MGAGLAKTTWPWLGWGSWQSCKRSPTKWEGWEIFGCVSFDRRLEYMPSHTIVRLARAVRSWPSGVLYNTPLTASPSSQAWPSSAIEGGFCGETKGNRKLLKGAPALYATCGKSPVGNVQASAQAHLSLDGGSNFGFCDIEASREVTFLASRSRDTGNLSLL